MQKWIQCLHVSLRYLTTQQFCCIFMSSISQENISGYFVLCMCVVSISCQIPSEIGPCYRLTGWPTYLGLVNSYVDSCKPYRIGTNHGTQQLSSPCKHILPRRQVVRRQVVQVMKERQGHGKVHLGFHTAQFLGNLDGLFLVPGFLAWTLTTRP